MKKNLEIQDFEDKKSQAGKRYVRFKTSDGWMSCFSDTASKALKELEGKVASVEIAQVGDFTNIKKCYGEAEVKDRSGDGSHASEEEETENLDIKYETPGEMPKESKSSKGTSYYTSYAKDIFVAFIAANANGKTGELNNEIAMKQAISVVKQAKEAFE